jgi:hypothetical protein
VAMQRRQVTVRCTVRLKQSTVTTKYIAPYLVHREWAHCILRIGAKLDIVHGSVVVGGQTLFEMINCPVWLPSPL